MSQDQNGEKPVVIVTGGGSGIGAGAARRLAREWQVAICGRRKEPLDAVAAETGAVPFVSDIGDPEAARKLIADVVAHFGRLDGLVLNAGILINAPFGEMSLDAWNQQIGINLTGPFVLAQAALPHLLARKGAVVSITSVGGMQTGPGLAAYSASKAGLQLMTQALAYEHARDGLRANIVAPGWIRTEMGDEEMETMQIADDLEGAYAKVSEFVPQRRAGSSDEAAEAIAWLLSPAASFVNGAVLAVDGGSLVANVGMTFFDKITEGAA
ncbi:SDR family oxidoreductase [Sphingomonas histidinilytica]|jgi:NAD(P)-dependent dehydrogenase (short-subunit alcohol dehydrogenase family)|uniref:NAD(P)-dependent dehydrogenase, short-chain alcohol dehydrogenase family n=1 Tax=Rhizorhabdus histidinilytica TaxID=439228 RepID=A0A1T5CV85_9SPHN|nr:SDR family oxidoreductase [Rhizorhabdus histidinilytica]MBO9379148.1 SDR family oxidoreductase [Rhizorhabdus histidinilytica]QEH79057.1 SDR family oxidoreductase [Sphingomonas sp. C8-2]SKB63287.1 NAD(P)-dependent dehydrogenase, short-chain alcohol dehydrogenase family [Rhizorhabdus histidinilytica]